MCMLGDRYASAVLGAKLDVASLSILMNPCCKSCANAKPQQRVELNVAMHKHGANPQSVMGRSQDVRTRYISLHRNLFDLLPTAAVVHNRYMLAWMPNLTREATA